MEEYLHKTKSISDNLLLAGSPVTMDDLVTQTLASLDVEYNPIVAQLVNKANLTWVELQSTLMTYMNRLEQIKIFSNMNLGQPNVNLVTNKQDNR